MSPANLSTPRCLETAGCDTPECPVSAWTVSSPSRVRRSKIALRVGSERVLNRTSGRDCMQTHNRSVIDRQGGGARESSRFKLISTNHSVYRVRQVQCDIRFPLNADSQTKPPMTG